MNIIKGVIGIAGNTAIGTGCFTYFSDEIDIHGIACIIGVAHSALFGHIKIIPIGIVYILDGVTNVKLHGRTCLKEVVVEVGQSFIDIGERDSSGTITQAHDVYFRRDAGGTGIAIHGHFAHYLVQIAEHFG